MASQNIVVNLPMAAVNINQKEGVKLDASGYVTNASIGSGAWIMGFAETSIDNSSGSAGDKYIGVIFSGVSKLPTYVADTDAAGNWSSPIVIGDPLQFIEVGGKNYVTKAFETTSIVVGYALAANDGSTSGATVSTASVAILPTKAEKQYLV